MLADALWSYLRCTHTHTFTPHRMEEVMGHPFFADMNWELLIAEQVSFLVNYVLFVTVSLV